MKPLVIAHRGANLLAPENTLAAFRLAAQLGAQAVEFDVQLSRDGEVVVIHDAELERTTDGRGSVATSTAAELRRLDAGSWFGPQYANERIPLLREVLELPLIPVIEIKTTGGQSRQLADRLAELLNVHGRSDAIIISGTSAPLRELQRLLPDARSLSFEDGTLTPAGLPPALTAGGAFSCGFAPPAPGLAGSIRQAVARGAAVLGTTLWVEAEWDGYLAEQAASGLTGIFTDDPAALHSWLTARQAG